MTGSRDESVGLALPRLHVAVAVAALLGFYEPFTARYVQFMRDGMSRSPGAEADGGKIHAHHGLLRFHR